MSERSPSLKPLPAALVSEWLQDLDSGADDPQRRILEDSLWRLRESAAVLMTFDPETLCPQPGSAAFDTNARSRFRSDIVEIDGAPAAASWALTTGIRQLALERLAGPDAEATRLRLERALAANPDRVRSEAQELLEAAIAGRVPALETLSSDQLTALSSIVSWLSGLVAGLPDRESLARVVARADLTHPFRQLTGSWFVGRQDELLRLADHVGVLPIETGVSMLNSVLQLSRRWTAAAVQALTGVRPPLFLYGPGGVGKSTLLARFILDHLQQGQGDSLPFVFLDVDRPGVEPLRPLTFLVESLGQLQYQFEGIRAPARELASRMGGSLARAATSQLESVIDPVGEHIAAFAALVNPYLANRPLLFIVDTFEEVQFLGSDAVFLVHDLITRLQALTPQLRVVFSGRVLPESIDVYGLPVRELQEDAAAELLARTLASLNRSDLEKAVLAETVAMVGGNPMVLRLAARLLAEQDLAGIRQAGRRRERLRRVRLEALQARLYGRVLGHIHDVQVRKLAFPGLVVRRITPAVVKEVLAAPCGLVLEGEQAAEHLVEKMMCEVALVTRDPQDGALIYRPDIRRVMLQSLDDVVPAETVRLIDEKAVAFWKTQEGAAARAEEIYHRLRLGQPREALEASWRPECASLLRGALGEFEGDSRIWLANKVGVSLDKNSRADALQSDWEVQVERSARRLLEAGRASEALTALRERTERADDSTLYALEVRALYALDRNYEALNVAKHGLEKLNLGHPDATVRVDLQLLCALTLEKAGDLAESRAQAEEAARLAEEAALPVPALQAQLRLARLQRHMSATPQAQEAHRKRAVDLLAASGIDRVRSDQGLLRDAAAEIGDLDADLLRIAFEQLGAEALGSMPRERLLEVLVQVVGMSAAVATELIGGDVAELAKIATPALLRIVVSGEARERIVEPLIRAFQTASERSARLPDRAAEDPFAVREAAPAAQKSAPLSKSQGAQLLKTIVDTSDTSGLGRLLRVYLSRDLYDYVTPSMSFVEQVQQVLRSASAQGWAGDLLRLFQVTSAQRWNSLGELRGHTDVILRITWNSSSRQIATGSVDKTARIWDVEHRREVAQLKGHTEGVNQATWSPGGARFIATCSYDHTIRLWAAGDWRCVRVIEGHTDDIPDVVWSPDGRWLASASVDRSVALWDAMTGDRLATASRSNSPGGARRVLFLDSGETLVSCWQDGHLCLHRVPHLDSVINTAAGPGGGLIGVDYSPTLGLLAACTTRGLIRVWRYPSLEIERDLVAGPREVRSLTFSPDGSLLAANTYGREGEVRLWTTVDWQEASRFSEPTSEYWPPNIAWAPSGLRLASLTEKDRVVRLRELSEPWLRDAGTPAK